MPDTQRRSGRILVVEDDPTVGAIIQEVLDQNHGVRLFVNGKQAFDHFEPGLFDVAIT